MLSKYKKDFFLPYKKGFTILELVIALSIITILSTVGLAAFSTGSKSAILETTASDIVSTIQTARSRAISQVKLKDDTQCLGTLLGYKVTVSIINETYSLYIVCSQNVNTAAPIFTKTLPDDVSFGNNTTLTSVFFPVLTSSVEGTGSIYLSGFGKTKNITVDNVGGVTVKNE